MLHCGFARREPLALSQPPGNNRYMSMSQDHLFETALSLPQAERADLAFQLLESLEPPGEDVSSDEFAAELHERVEAYRRGEAASSSLEETRRMIERRLSEGSAQ